MNTDTALLVSAAGIMLLMWLWWRQRFRQAVKVFDKDTTNFQKSKNKGVQSKRKPPDFDQALLGEVCIEVAARLRAGSTPQLSWKGALERRGFLFDQGTLSDLLASVGPLGDVVNVGVRFSDHTGAPLAQVLETLAHTIAETQRVQEGADVAFAGPRSSARVLTALPLLGLVGAQLLGANPLAWFFSGAAPASLAVLGGALAVAGRGVSAKMIRRVSDLGANYALAPALADLVSAGISSGQSVPLVLQALSDAGADGRFGEVGRELILGATWSEAWDDVPAGGDLLERALEPAWNDGISPTAMLTGLAVQDRAVALAQVRVAAEKVGVKLALPLGLLMLPSFVILGLLPVFFSLVGGSLLSG